MRKLLIRDWREASNELSGTSNSACLARRERILSDNSSFDRPQAPRNQHYPSISFLLE